MARRMRDGRHGVSCLMLALALTASLSGCAIYKAGYCGEDDDIKWVWRSYSAREGEDVRGKVKLPNGTTIEFEAGKVENRVPYEESLENATEIGKKLLNPIPIPD